MLSNGAPGGQNADRSPSHGRRPAAGEDLRRPVCRVLRRPGRDRPGDGDRLAGLHRTDPLFILASAFAPTGDEDTVAEGMIRRFDLAGDAATAVRTLFAHSTDSTTGVLSVVLLVFSGLSLARRMQRMYLDAWRLDPLQGVRGSLNAALGLAALLLEVLLLSLARTVVRGLPFDSLFGPVLSAWRASCCGRRSRGCCWTAGSRGGDCSRPGCSPASAPACTGWSRRSPCRG